MPKELQLTRSQLCESCFYLNGYPFSLNDYPFLRAIYNLRADNLVLQFSRQTAKSTTLANILISNSLLIPYFHSLYVAPSSDQAKIFSHDRIKPVLEESPFIKKHYLSAKLMQNVFSKILTNGSRLFIRYGTKHTAFRLRGISADINCFDETQDIDSEIIPIIQETMSRSMYKRTIYVGTPKRTRGTLATIFNRSTKNEWIVKCDSCGKYNYLNETNIGDKGLICKKCGKQMNPKNGQWVPTNQAGEFPGFRVCALQFDGAPWVDWKKDIIDKQKLYARAQYFNEVLALPYDEGVSPVTEADLRNCCCDKTMAEMMNRLSHPLYIGIDWGPATSTDSFTVMIMLYYDYVTNKIVVPFMKKYMGKEADFHSIHGDIVKRFHEHSVNIIAADYGLGESSTSELRSKLGYDRVMNFYYSGSLKEETRWQSKLQAYLLNKVLILNNFFDNIKKGNFIFPRWAEFREYAQDLLNLQIDYNIEKNKTSYFNIGPDDITHAMVFASVLEKMARAPSFSSINIED